MIELIASELWMLFYLAATIGMLGCAWYSRHQVMQKTATCLLLIYIASQVFWPDPGEGTPAVFYVLDAGGLLYCMLLGAQHANRGALFTGGAFIPMIAGHFAGGIYLDWAITINLLYLSQLIILSTYSIGYGKTARRAPPRRRDDMFYKAVQWFNPVTIQ
ncbi:MAG: hypothetical protein ACR2PR_05835 [Pseudohongiellaceae bacterium]